MNPNNPLGHLLLFPCPVVTVDIYSNPSLRKMINQALRPLGMKVWETPPCNPPCLDEVIAEVEGWGFRMDNGEKEDEYEV